MEDAWADALRAAKAYGATGLRLVGPFMSNFTTSGVTYSVNAWHVNGTLLDEGDPVGTGEDPRDALMSFEEDCKSKMRHPVPA